MPKTQKVQRVTLRVVEKKPGQVFMEKITDSVVTMPFVWPSMESAKRDMSIVVEALLKKGYTVVDNEGKEVKPAAQ